ncbi:sensor histidine kinase [Caballeronia calidae]|uniref:sensor histidine kinase n=1 Tax=Caballeronia calidae TaxID=1777139 RepID=UPI0012FE0E30|nr:ATP-binding protein [Caballeronia calidae]
MIALVLIAALALVTYKHVLETSLGQLSRTSRQRLDFLTAVTGQTLEKYESMPYVLSQQGSLIDLLEHPEDGRRAQSVNDYLKRVQEKTKPLVVYLLDHRGRALASSNSSEPRSFVGNDYSFRPYFIGAMQGRAGRFYGVGTTTTEPGYFLSYPLYKQDADPSQKREAAPVPIGVVVVKISLGDLERAWSDGPDEVALADADGVVFLSSNSMWRYRTLGPLAPDVQKTLLQTRQYGDAALARLPMRASQPLWGSAVPSAAHTGLVYVAGNSGTSPLLMQTSEVGPLSWKLLTFSNTEATFAGARNVAIATGSASALVALLTYTLWLRRRRLLERQAARVQLQRINDELEMRIADRTQVLVDANANMERKLSELSEAEGMLRATQDQAIQAGKLAVLGQMSAGIAHEIAQPLTAMRILSENAHKLLSAQELGEAADNMIEIGSLCRKAGSIVGQLKGFAQKSTEAFEPVLVERVVADAVALVRREGENAGIEFDVLPPVRPIWVLGNDVRLEQVLINLLRNAFDAMKDSPRKRICVRFTLDARHVLLRVRDTGTGIATPVLNRLFEPFFSTKAPGAGLGLGLAISAAIVQGMRGELRAENHSEGGAVFTLILPLAPSDRDEETT